jgi:hypothetical protein
VSAPCVWHQDFDDVWETDCQHAFCVTDGTPVENEFKFCCFCGGSLVQELYCGGDE